jgi:hypothetical protein
VTKKANVLVLFCCDQIPKKSNLREEGLFWFMVSEGLVLCSGPITRQLVTAVECVTEVGHHGEGAEREIQ